MSDNVDEKYIMENIIKNFFREKGTAAIQTDSFNEFINTGIQNIIDGESVIKTDINSSQSCTIKFGNIFVTNANIIDENREVKNIYPQEAQTRDLNYEATMLCNITEKLYENDTLIGTTIHTRVPIGRIPIMIGSDKCNLKSLSTLERMKRGECEWDKGGYFIIRGNDRAVVAQLRTNYNQSFVLKDNKDNFCSEIRSMSDETGHSVQIKMKFDNKSIMVSIPYIKALIPIGVLFKALGFLEDSHIYNFIGLKHKDAQLYIRYIIKDSLCVKSTEEALEYIGKNSIHIIPKTERAKYAKQVCETELFPHMGICVSNKDICIMLGYITNKLLSTKIGNREPDNRDNYVNKRVETTGILCTELFRPLFKRYINTLKIQLDKKKSKDILSIVRKTNTITQGFNYSFSTGNWGVQKNKYIRKGVSQVMSRLTYGATLSHLRRIVIPIGKEGKNAAIRQIHSSQFGYICPAETPEGQSAGIVLNFSLLARVTTQVPIYIVKEIMEECEFIIKNKDISIDNIYKLTHIFLNGVLILAL